MWSQAKIEALVKESSNYRPATQEEKEQFFVKLEQQLPMRDELLEILNSRERITLFVDRFDPAHYCFQLQNHESAYLVSDSYFTMLE